MLKKLTSSILIATLLTGLVACNSQPKADTGSAETALPGAGITLRPAYSGWIEALFYDEIVRAALEQLGYKVEKPAAVKYSAMFQAIANGELDYTPEYNYYNHDALFKKAGGDAKLERVGKLLDITSDYEIDRRTAEKYHITNLEQFKDPKIAKLFDYDGDGKANLVGCDPGWGCELTIEHHLDAYGLRATVEDDQGEYNTLMADAITRYKQGQPILYFTSSTTPIPALLKVGEDVVQLEVPFTSLPGEEQSKITEKETTINGKNVGFPVDNHMFLVNDQLLAKNPVIKRLFESIQIPPEDFSAEALRIQKGENRPNEIHKHAGEWIKQHQALFDSWVKKARGN